MQHPPLPASVGRNRYLYYRRHHQKYFYHHYKKYFYHCSCLQLPGRLSRWFWWWLRAITGSKNFLKNCVIFETITTTISATSQTRSQSYNHNDHLSHITRPRVLCTPTAGSVLRGILFSVLMLQVNRKCQCLLIFLINHVFVGVFQSDLGPKTQFRFEKLCKINVQNQNQIQKVKLSQQMTN